MYDLNAMFCKHIKMKHTVIFFKSMPIDKLSRKLMGLLYIIYMPHKFSGEQLRCGKAKSNRIRAVAGQRSSPGLCFATKFIKIYDP